MIANQARERSDDRLAGESSLAQASVYVIDRDPSVVDDACRKRGLQNLHKLQDTDLSFL
jgi:hypothetical protein